ncbi:MAG: hypothetical protein ITG05_08930 [Pseudomonas stutzeri]|uniref:hypothetical protein n=1 Tax=Stutzerimonas stutzeri TaxID=316 RepID=UPI00210C3C05|nr:hypothetical protein [Stutzerimonas stutzeri]MBF6623625.1 hypothetical protein [Stutzerimonas stutzeri]MCQ4241337.1 hypothetical protein [Stutzerimonas stutzeri]
MNRQARFSLVGKGFLAAAVVTLIIGAEQPMSQPFSQTPHESVERIRLYDAQPIGIVQTGPAANRGDALQLQPGQRWVF